MFYPVPTQLEELENIKAIGVGSSFSYAIQKQTGKVYSWGMGENYVLGSRDDDNQWTPYEVDPRMFKEKDVLMVKCGGQHVVAMVKANEEAEEKFILEPNVLEYKTPSAAKAIKRKAKEPREKKIPVDKPKKKEEVKKEYVPKKKIMPKPIIEQAPVIEVENVTQQIPQL